ncbi:ATP-dependent DNA helicase RecG [Roseospira marina]|uniref:ATP-dependent DNA helicase RecG n=1 Tax=Roseospira marina TaxID=140057 RepID=A0A5M6IDF6_9PROT|nr:ATP-dependent DNA helicase RecG [Roseospira marina]KAA5605648.1 ATP-dependent DNA helicase RecG [Roseospira marina]MBB4313276.1 ATP-dependent DNA helicase RecG [Roseospira marina]MBB5085983.1 ATP-dependent DNA helicase RecG [Roseospira marina]
MRPELLYPLFQPVDSLKGVGSRVAPLVHKLAGPKVVDVLWHLPTGVIDRRYRPTVAEAIPGKVATLVLTVDEHRAPPPGSRAPYRVAASDATGTLTLVYFRAGRDYMMKLLPPGEQRAVSGRIEVFNDLPQMAHPDHVVPLSELASIQTIEPVYPMTQGLAPRVLRKIVLAALAAGLKVAQGAPEWLDPTLVARRGWPTWGDALRAAHEPADDDAVSPLSPARQRLAYDELLATQLALSIARAKMRARPGRPREGDGAMRAAALAGLPFALTRAQSTALDEIAADMARPSRMLRLLQGDVGSGKTVVAWLAMLIALETGAQAALMAPTEILARQHMETLTPLAEAIGVRIALLTGRDKGKPREETLAALEAGTIRVIVGTHALFQDDVRFRDLGLVVIDEQHRFGVDQRLGLSSKGPDADVLVMTATPIPRTLTLTHYGDMDISRLDEKPPGRQPIETVVLPTQRLPDVIAAIQRAIAAGNKVYWVCPLVAESETDDVAAAEGRYEDLRQILGGRVGLVHGRMKAAEKDAVMERFAGEGVDVLVATTVIEVGVNVPAATVMVIEHAERFGLAQLHQLRGRIGRGSAKSTCLLLYQGPLGEIARDRLQVIRTTEDGFVIAEEDLRLRGAGEVLGTRQSGLPNFRLADLAAHADLLDTASADARLILERDPDLTTPRGQALRVLLYLFERDAAVRTVRSG